jgi:hypothetical protein
MGKLHAGQRGLVQEKVARGETVLADSVIDSRISSAAEENLPRFCFFAGETVR